MREYKPRRPDRLGDAGIMKSQPGGHDGSRQQPFMTIAEAANLARVSAKRLRNLMGDGTLVEGLHYTRPRNLGPRFRRDAVLAWLDGREDGPTVDAIPPARHRRPRCRLDESPL